MIHAMIHGRIQLLGHVIMYGSISPSTDFPGLLRIVTVAVRGGEEDRDGRRVVVRGADARTFLVGPGAIYRVEPMSEASCAALAHDAATWSAASDPDQGGDDEIPF